MVVSKKVERILMDLTGEPEPEVALHMALGDILAHRLEIIQGNLKEFEKKYNMSFADFESAWKKDKLPAKYSYDVEKDYWEWEGFISRKKKLQELSKWFG